MKHKYSKNSIASIILALIFILESCSIYKKTPVTLDEASNVNRTVRITRMNDKKLNFRKIEKTDSIYYGINKIKGELVKVPLDEKDIKKIRLIDRTATTLVNIGIITLSTATILLLIAAAALSDMDFSNPSTTK